MVVAKTGEIVFGTNSPERGLSVDCLLVVLVAVVCAGEERCVCVRRAFPPPLRFVEGEKSGEVGLSLELLAMGGEQTDCEGLNTGAEGLSLEFGGEKSGVLGLIEELLLSMSRGGLGGARVGVCSIFLAFPSIGVA